MPAARTISLSILYALLCLPMSRAQEVQPSATQIAALTPQWRGDRSADGRPRVADDIIERMRLVTIEEAWAVLRNQNFNHQYAGDWQVLNPGDVLVGRAVTAVFMPGRPDVHRVIQAQGMKDGRSGAQNSWPVDMLQSGDVYVGDQFGLQIDGPTIGDNVGSAIFANSGNGIVYNGALRDIAGLQELEGFTAFFRSYHPSHHLNNPDGALNTTLVSINAPTRIGDAMVMPGDVVLGRDGGVIFIPPHLAERVVQTSEIVRLRDLFGQQRLREGVYTAGEIDTRWSDDIERDFSGWLEEHIDELPVPAQRIQELLEERTW